MSRLTMETNGEEIEFQPWVATLVTAIVVFCFLYSTAIQYTYGCVVATLTTIEDPSTTAILTTKASDEPAPPPYRDDEDTPAPADVKRPLLDLDAEPELLLIQHKPITASARGTVAHLRSRTGSFLSRFRGFGVLMVYGTLLHVFCNVWHMFFRRSLVFTLLGALAGPLMLARIHLVWTHMVMSEPRPDKRFYERMVPRRTARKILLPTAAVSLATLAVPIVPVVVLAATSYGKIKHPADMTNADWAEMAMRMALGLAAFVLTTVFVAFPAYVAYVRCQAALLPADETPIVPFDRTFGGLVVPESEGGSGRLRMRDAWRSFDWNGRVRLVKVFAKMVVLQVAVTVGGALLVAATMVASGAHHKVIAEVRRQF